MKRERGGRELLAAWAGVLIAQIAVAFAVGNAFAVEPIVYPTKGQSDAKIEKDKLECAAWARGQTSIDPNEPAPTAPEEPLLNGKRIEGAAPGAARGAASGAIGGPLGAGIGAAVGAGVGARRSEQAYRAEEAQHLQQAQDAHQQRLDTYFAAQAACLSGRGYVVK